MVDAGLGRRPPSDIADLLARADNSATSPPAPPQGLYFVTASYPTAAYAGICDTADAVAGAKVSQ
jgi:tRNA U38,U39,U40 pseudouridine synthase TruA